MSFFRRKTTPMILDVARFGGRMTWEEVQTTLRDRQNDAVFRAIAQILEYQRQRCQLAVQDKSNLPDGQMAFEAGAAASAADVLAMMTEIADQKCADGTLKAWFGGQIRTKQD